MSGISELIDVVDELNKSCPWTLSMSSKKMLKFVEEEVCEVGDEIDAIIRRKTSSGDEATPLESELGDLLFDALMLVSICSREYPSQVRDGGKRIWSYAARKIKSRTPYMKKWRTDESCVAKNKEDAEKMWIAAKKREKRKKKKNAFDVMMRASRRAKFIDDADTTPPPQTENDIVKITKQNNNKDSSFIVDARPQTEEARERCRNMNRHIENFFKSTKKTRRTFLAYDERMLNHKPAVERRHPEIPERVAVIWKSLEKYVEQCEIIKTSTSTAITREDMLTCHDRTYIERLETLSSKDTLASDTYHNEHTLLAAKIASECALNLTKRLLSITKTKANGYAVIRPPGHHCSHAKTHGFCVLNNVAIAARHASCVRKKRVAVFDWDVHHGDGTERILRDDPNVLYISVHRHENGKFFPFTGAVHENVETSVNLAWSQKGMGDAEYVVAFERVILPIMTEFDPDLVLVSAGFDAATGDQLGGMHVTPSVYGFMTHVLCTRFQRVGLVLEGGYSLSMLSACSLECVRSLLGKFEKKTSRRYFIQESAFKDICSAIKVQQTQPRGIRLNMLKSSSKDLCVLSNPVLFTCSGVVWNEDTSTEVRICSVRDAMPSNVCALVVYKNGVVCCAVLLEKSVSMMRGTKGPSWQIRNDKQSHNFTFPTITSALRFARIVSRQSAVGTTPSEPLAMHLLPEIRKIRAWIVSDPENVIASSSLSDDTLSCGCLTKLMTLRVALLERTSFEQKESVTVTSNAVKIQSKTKKSRLKLTVGESMSLHDVAIGVLMCDGGGLATLLAEHTTSSLDDFVKRMHEEASRLGMSHTRFVDPCGFSSENVSTLRDMELLCRACMSSFWFPLCSVQRHKRWRSGNRLLTQQRTDTVRQVDGMLVERYPNKIGSCSALTFVRRSDGKRVLVIVLNAVSCSKQVCISESKLLGDWATSLSACDDDDDGDSDR